MKPSKSLAEHSSSILSTGPELQLDSFAEAISLIIFWSGWNISLVMFWRFAFRDFWCGGVSKPLPVIMAVSTDLTFISFFFRHIFVWVFSCLESLIDDCCIELTYFTFFLATFSMILFNFILVVCKFLLSSFLNFCFLLLHTLLHHRNSTLQRWSFYSRCLQLTYQKVVFFLKNFLKSKVFVKWCIFHIFLNLG